MPELRFWQAWPVNVGHAARKEMPSLADQDACWELATTFGRGLIPGGRKITAA